MSVSSVRVSLTVTTAVGTRGRRVAAMAVERSARSGSSARAASRPAHAWSSTQYSPSVAISFFQIGTRSFNVSIA